MRLWHFWWRTISTQYNPPESIEHLMVLLTIALFLRWGFEHEWQYLLLSSSLALGAGASIWVREMILPSHRSRLLMLLLVSGLLLYSFFAGVSLVDYL